MRLLKFLYEKIKKKPAPYYYNYNLLTLVTKPIRKWMTNVVAANCPFHCVRIAIYRLCGFRIGRKTFIGMRCYLDDMCYDQLVIGNGCTISYGVFFSCHGRNQGHMPIVIEDNVYIGMRSSIISKNVDKQRHGVTIGNGAVIGACTLVNRDIPGDSTAVGVPCRIIKHGESDHE